MTNKQVYFVTGIDTDIGKSYATGFIAKTMAECGEKVITQKFIQTGNTDISEDIQLHRKIMGLELQPVDKEGVTCPIVFTYPASPHLSAKIDNREIDLKKVNQATQTLHKTYDIVLIEGAGGVMVPISQEFLTIDYVAAERLSVILVTTPRLGSISHTLLTLDACKNRSIPVHMLAYNEFRVDDNVISQDTKVYLKQYLAQHFPQTQWLDVPKINVSANHLNSVA